MTRASRKPLTEGQIVDAALAVTRTEGLEALTMRRLSRELGMSPMAAYYYVGNKEELLDLVAARALADINVPAGANLPWHVRLHMLIDRIDAELRHHRGVGEVLVDRMHTTQRHIMRGMMGLLEEAGFDDADVLKAYAMVHTYLFGRHRMFANPPMAEDGRAEVDDEGDIVSRIQPLVRSLRGWDYYEFGVETIIAGLRARLESRDQRQPESPQRPVVAAH